ALPAPLQPEPPEGDALPEFALADAIEEASPLPPAAAETEPNGDREVIAMGRQRQMLKGRALKDAMFKFVADINGALSASNAGYTVGQLAPGADRAIGDWFAAGMTVENAATRCAGWRRIRDVLPPEEMLDGEGDQPANMLETEFRKKIAEDRRQARA